MKKYVEFNPKLKPCKICGSPGVVDGWDDGIGDVKCSNPQCTNLYFHYSGKFERTKLEAIGMWNGYNMEKIWRA